MVHFQIMDSEFKIKNGKLVVIRDNTDIARVINPIISKNLDEAQSPSTPDTDNYLFKKISERINGIVLIERIPVVSQPGVIY